MDTINGSRPDGFIAKVEFYVQGLEHALAILSPTTNDVDHVPIYEFRNYFDFFHFKIKEIYIFFSAIGGPGNSLAFIRRFRHQHPPVAQVYRPVLDMFEPIKVRLEVKTSKYLMLPPNT